jgi:hypothetical protein
MSDSAPILIAAINARHSHASMGARCLLANMGDLRPQTELLEFTIQQSASEIAAVLIARAPKILALGVYIWNATRIAELLPLLRHQSPQTKIILGGPELPSVEPPTTSSGGDFLILGEADLAFPALCHEILSSDPHGLPCLHPCPSVVVSALRSPIFLPSNSPTPNTPTPISPTACSTSNPPAAAPCAATTASPPTIRTSASFPMPALLAAFDQLLARGARQFKFCDRSFNLDIPRAVEILAFFLDRFPATPASSSTSKCSPTASPPNCAKSCRASPRAPSSSKSACSRSIPHVLDTIRRPQNLERAADNLRFLREHTHAFLHTDLIAGLPGETPESFAAGFDRLVALDPHEIQLGILKKLPGAPIARHDDEFAMVYNSAPPYEILSTRDWPAEHLARTARFAHYWDAIVSSNRFLAAAPLIWQDAPSVFASFLAFSDWMAARFPREHGVPLPALVEAVFDFLTQVRGLPPDLAADALIRGYRHTGARDIPPALAPHLRREPPPPTHGLPKPLRRQFLRWTWDDPLAFGFPFSYAEAESYHTQATTPAERAFQKTQIRPAGKTPPRRTPAFWKCTGDGWFALRALGCRDGGSECPSRHPELARALGRACFRSARSHRAIAWTNLCKTDGLILHSPQTGS